VSCAPTPVCMCKCVLVCVYATFCFSPSSFFRSHTQAFMGASLRARNVLKQSASRTCARAAPFQVCVFFGFAPCLSVFAIKREHRYLRVDTFMLTCAFLNTYIHKHIQLSQQTYTHIQRSVRQRQNDRERKRQRAGGRHTREVTETDTKRTGSGIPRQRYHTHGLDRDVIHMD